LYSEKEVNHNDYSRWITSVQPFPRLERSQAEGTLQKRDISLLQLLSTLCSCLVRSKSRISLLQCRNRVTIISCFSVFRNCPNTTQLTYILPKDPAIEKSTCCPSAVLSVSQSTSLASLKYTSVKTMALRIRRIAYIHPRGLSTTNSQDQAQPRAIRVYRNVIFQYHDCFCCLYFLLYSPKIAALPPYVSRWIV
jgi:hypothetical protein